MLASVFCRTLIASVLSVVGSTNCKTINVEPALTDDRFARFDTQAP